MANVSQLTLLNGQVLTIKDAYGRQLAENNAVSKVSINQGVQNEGKILKVSDRGMLELVEDTGSEEDFTGATSSQNGAHGLVPAPAAGEQDKVLMGNGNWAYASSASYTFALDPVTNTSGAYSHTTIIPGVSEDMKPYKLELGNPAIFGAEIYVTCENGNITLTCGNVAGESSVKVTVMKQVSGNGLALSSDEYIALNNRISQIESVLSGLTSGQEEEPSGE